MIKKLFYILTFVAVPVAIVTAGPKPIEATVILHDCPCNGGCEDITNYSDCGNGYCAWFCHGAPE